MNKSSNFKVEKNKVAANHLLSALIITICTIVVYWQVINFDFTNYDDDKLIINQEKFLNDIKNILTSFQRDVFNNPSRTVIFYRPILTVSFILTYKVFGLSASAFHLVNLFLHLFNTFAVYFFLYILFKNRTYALLGSLIFCVHPVQTESVAWIAGRNDLLLGSFTLLVMIFYSINFKSKLLNNLFFVLSVFSFLLAMFTKEPAVFFILLIFLYHIFFVSGRLSQLLSGVQFLKLFSFVVAIGIYLFVRYLVFGTLFGSETLYKNSTFSQHLINSPLVISTYLQLLSFPVNLSVIHAPPTVSSGNLFIVIISYLIVIILIYISIKYFKKLKYTSFGILWILLSLIPASNIIPTPMPILEHRLYVPMIGFSVLICSLLNYFSTQKIVKYFIFILILVYGFLSILRLPVWKNSETLWIDVIQKGTTYDLAYYSLGTFYLQNNRLQEGINQLEKAYSINPNKLDVLTNLGYAYTRTRQYQKAIDVYKRLLENDPSNEQAYLGLGNSLKELKMYQDAEIIYKKGIEKIPDSEKLHYELALCYGLMKEHQKAELELKESIRINRNYAPAYFSLGGLYSFIGKDSLAIKYINEGIKYGQPSPGVYFVLSNSYLRLKDTVKYIYYKGLYEQLK